MNFKTIIESIAKRDGITFEEAERKFDDCYTPIKENVLRTLYFRIREGNYNTLWELYDDLYELTKK